MPEKFLNVVRVEGTAHSPVASYPLGPDDDVTLEEDGGNVNVLLNAKTDANTDSVLRKTQETVRAVPITGDQQDAIMESEGGIHGGVDPGEDAAVAEDAPGAGTAALPTGPDGSSVGTGQPAALEAEAKEAEEAEAAEAAEDDEAVAEAEAGETEEPNATTAAVNKAEELGVDLSTVEGTGADGRITVGDVEAAAEES